MLHQVELTAHELDDYRLFADDETVDHILAMAEPLRGARVVHVNATAYGGGVAEMLATLVPLMCNVGLDAEWQVIEGTDEFFGVTKACHNGLQGMDIPFTEEMKDIWRQQNERNAKLFEGRYDLVVVHDPQPAGLYHYSDCNGTAEASTWIWRCHIDTSSPNEEYWDFFAPYIRKHDRYIFTMREYVGPGIGVEKVEVIHPTIDPLSPKNQPMDKEALRTILSDYGLDPAQDLITQVSRFDPWKDPVGVIDAYRLVKEEVPQVKLALIGSMASDDPEGQTYLEKTREHAGDDPDIHILTNLHDKHVAAFQQASSVVLQKSLREGFGLTVSEALWKGTPVIGGAVGGIRLQIEDGNNGYLVNSVPECAERILDLLRHPERRAAMGRVGRETVRKNFLTTRHLADYLRLFTSLA